MRALIVDDQAVFRAGLASLLRAWDFTIVGQAGDGEEAIQRALETRPEIIFMDIRMPRRNGLEATRAVKALMPDIKIVMLTVSDDEADLFEAIKSGAEGYLLKNLPEEEFASFVSRIKAGEPVMSRGLAHSLLREFGRLRGAGREGEEVTDRERDVLEMVAKGSTNREIAAALFITENTVNYHMKRILATLHLRNRAQVAAWARDHGFPSRPPS